MKQLHCFLSNQHNHLFNQLNFQSNFEIPSMPEQKAASSSLLHGKLPSVVMQQPQITAQRGKQHHQNRRAERDKYYSCTHDLMLHLSYFKNHTTEIDAVFNLTLLFLILFQIIVISKIQNDYGILHWFSDPKAGMKRNRHRYKVQLLQRCCLQSPLSI